MTIHPQSNRNGPWRLLGRGLFAGRYRLVGASSLPLVGAAHPLEEGNAARAWAAAGCAILFHLALFTLWQARFGSELVPIAEAPGPGTIVDLHNYERPKPAIVPKMPSVPSLPGTLLEPFVPEPVPDAQVQDFDTPAPQGFLSGVPDGVDGTEAAIGDLVAIHARPADDLDPGPADFVAYEVDPSLIELPAPSYPELARAAEVEGRVLLRALVGKDGKVRDVRVVAGHPMLNDAAVAAVRRSIWRPALQQHRPVAVWVDIPIVFSLH
ncbi:MAG: TonB family protein [Candidatus Eisenbacteria bacterium]